MFNKQKKYALIAWIVIISMIAAGFAYKKGWINVDTGLAYLSSVFGRIQTNADEDLYTRRNTYITPESLDDELKPGFLPTFSNIDKLKNFADIKRFLYTIDETAYADEELLDIDRLLNVDIKTQLTKDPKILIFHTHSQEEFIDSRKGEQTDTIVGVGNVLADILAKNYGIGVVHDQGQYDVVDDRMERGNSYERMEPSVRAILEQYPSIEIAIDLHRDGVKDDVRLVTEIDGQDTARIMFFNGIISENDGNGGKAVDLPNPFLTENLAFSLKMHLTANELYPGFTRHLYIKPYRYSLHMLPKSLLVEVGANTNTVQEAKNAMKPLAEILVKALQNG